MLKKYLLVGMALLLLNNTLKSSEYLKIAGGWSAAGLAYVCLLHNQITVRYCPEYYNLLIHCLELHNESSTYVAIESGVYLNTHLAVLGGGIIALASQAGDMPKLDLKNTLKYMAGSVASMGVGALIFSLGKSGSRACGLADNGARIGALLGIIGSISMILSERVKMGKIE